MGSNQLAAPPRQSFRELALVRVHRLLTGSLMLYLAATILQRTWELLNSDVGVLLRRLH
jgi:hypothetical protein